MYKFKSITITTCVVLSSIVMFSSSTIAAPAIVQSDSSLKFDDAKLQQVLTTISDKESNLNIVFYSTNTLSSNTVVLPNSSKVNKAVYANDNFIGTIKKPNYISFYYNKDDANPNKGSFSVNVGSDFRNLISKEDISNNIVKPNISKYLPQDPESFIPVVAEQVVIQIKAKQLQIAKDVESKQAWDNTVKVVMFGFIIVLLFIIVYYLIKATVNKLTTSLKNYKEWQETLDNANINYSKLLGQSSYLTGYTGATSERANNLLTRVNELNDKYLALNTFPKFINEIMYNNTWVNYTIDLVNFNNSLNGLLEEIDSFLKSIEGLSGTDPLAEVIRLQQLKDKQNRLNTLVSTFNQQYQDGSNFLNHSNIHSFKAQAFTSLNSNDDINTKIDSFKVACDAINKEVILINRLSKLKQFVKEIANYIISNNNTYYSNLNPISDKNKEWAKQLLTLSTNHTNYFDLKPVEDIKQDLDFFAIEYKQQDAQYRVTTERKASLINKVNITVPTKFVLIRDRLLKEIREVTINNNYNLTEQALDKLEKEVNSLIKDANNYKSRQAKLSKYNSSRKTELTKQLDNNNYSNFDVLIVNYDKEDERTKRSSYSSYNSNPSSYSDNNSSPSSSSWSSSSSDDSSWSSSSSNDSSSSSSSSDDSW